MTAFEAGAPLRRQRRIRPSGVDRPNWKAECAETCLLRLERGKDCKALPIATLHRRALPGYPLLLAVAASDYSYKTASSFPTLWHSVCNKRGQNATASRQPLDGSEPRFRDVR